MNLKFIELCRLKGFNTTMMMMMMMIIIIIIIIYKDRLIEAVHVECKSKMIPVIMGTIGSISESFRQHLSNAPGKHEIKELQKKTAILGTAHIGTAESTTVKVQNTLNVRNNISCNVNCEYTTAATLCNLETWFASGI